MGTCAVGVVKEGNTGMAGRHLRGIGEETQGDVVAELQGHRDPKVLQNGETMGHAVIVVTGPVRLTFDDVPIQRPQLES